MPKRNGATPVVQKPTQQINSIVAGNRQNAPSSTAMTSNEHTLSASVSSKNGPIVTTVQNHSNNPDKHLAVIQENKVRLLIFQ